MHSKWRIVPGYVPTRSRRWTYCIGWMRTILFILFLKIFARKLSNYFAERRIPPSDSPSFVLWKFSVDEGLITRIFLIRKIIYQCLSMKLFYWCIQNLPRKSKYRALHYCSSQNSSIEGKLCGFAIEWNVNSFRTFYLNLAIKPKVRPFLKHFSTKWWWKMSGGNRSLHRKSTTFSGKRRPDFHLSLRHLLK